MARPIMASPAVEAEPLEVPVTVEKTQQSRKAQSAIQRGDTTCRP